MNRIEPQIGDNIQDVIKAATNKIPCRFNFNGCAIEIGMAWYGKEAAAREYFYNYYTMWSKSGTIAVAAKVAEKPCKNCGRNCFLTDKSCWWCELPNPTRP